MSIQIDKAAFDGDISDSLPLTAFGDLRNGELSPVFQGTFEYTVGNTEINTNVVSGGGIVTQADAMAVVSTSTTTASTACLRSHRLARYRAGLGSMLRFTTLFANAVALTEQHIGLVDTEGSAATFRNGLTVGYDGAVFGFHRFVNDEKITINIDDWDDPLDGSGPSGITLLPDKLNVWAINFEHLGAGPILLSIVQPERGVFIPVIRIKYPNIHVVPSSYNPNYHFEMFVNNKATTENLTIKSASYGYFIEGKTEPLQVQQPHFSSGLQSKSSIVAPTAIFSIRCKTAYAGKINFIEILLQLVQASIEVGSANNLGSISVFKDATITGAVWSDINSSNSVVEIDTTGTAADGELLFSLPLAGKNDADKLNKQDFGDKLLLHGETITIIGDSANSATINASALWKELF